MNDFTDDLLEDLENLEQSTEEVVATSKPASKASTHNQTQGSANSIDSASLSLEAAKASQTAASESQKAAQAAITLSNEFKAQIIELSDSNVAWRQAARQSVNELNANRSKMTIMMVISIIMAFITTGMAGWLFFYMSKKQEQYKGQVLDVIQTEGTLYNKKITLKVDQLSSMIEMLSADIQKLGKGQSLEVQRPQKSTLSIAEHLPEQPLTPETHTNTEASLTDKGHNSSLPLDLQHKTSIESAPHHENAQHTTEHHTDKASHTAEPHQIPSQSIPPSVSVEQFKHLKGLVEEILTKQQHMQASIMSSQALLQKAVHPTHSNVSKPSTTESKKQAKQLAAISWLVRQQTKTLKHIKAMLEANKKQPRKNIDLSSIKSALDALKQQIKNLSIQQKSVETQVQALKKQTDELAAKPKPYSYRVNP